MKTLPTHFATRVIWLLSGVGIGVTSIVDGVCADLLGQSISGVGMAPFGVAWFMQPVLFKAPLADLAIHAQEAVIGPAKLRTGLLFAAMACLLVGMILRYAFHI